MKGRLLLAFLSVAAVGWSQVPFQGRGTFPQFRDLSGLPGSGFGITVDGSPGLQGAIALSTPVGFSLSRGHAAIGAGVRSTDGKIRWINTSNRAGGYASDGTGQAMVGFSAARWGAATFSGMVLSSALDNAFNAQWQLPLSSQRFGFSLGCQNLWNRPNAAGEGVPGDNAGSRSYYAVGTYEIRDGAFLTLGKGDVRFRGLFGSACANMGPSNKALVEYDDFGWNFAVAHSLRVMPTAKEPFDRVEATLMLGTIQQRRTFLALNLTF